MGQTTAPAARSRRWRLRRRATPPAPGTPGRPIGGALGPADTTRYLTDFIPPEGVPLKFELASLSARFVAQLVDIVITLAALTALLAALFFADILPFNGLVGLAAILFFAIRAPYYILSEVLMNGQTLGKRLSGLRVISVDGRTLSAHAVTVRNMLKEAEVFVPGTMLLAVSDLSGWAAMALLAWIAVLFAVPLTSRTRQRLGDILAGTYVVALPKAVLLPDLASQPGPTRPHAAAQAFSFLPHQLDHYGRYELQTLEALLQVVPPQRSKSAAQRHADNLVTVARTIARRIDYADRIAPEAAEAFLHAFYRTQRAYLENRQLLGDARENKFHAAPDPAEGSDGSNRNPPGSPS